MASLIMDTVDSRLLRLVLGDVMVVPKLLCLPCPLLKLPPGVLGVPGVPGVPGIEPDLSLFGDPMG